MRVKVDLEIEASGFPVRGKKGNNCGNVGLGPFLPIDLGTMYEINSISYQ